MEVFLSPLAERKLEELLHYLERRWSQRVKNQFLEKFRASIALVKSYPESCRLLEGFPGVRKCVISKESSFFYRIHSEAIEIITVFDNRQDLDRVFNEHDF
ncbi:type II toxin-antitoxin system RelE/ParE family toxin [Algoriphagus sp. H41]|uniref:Type II toxin-antitoxin system RelE/ParE family toxin n=1 Tax=Algoriphagus oliviformis TaxID=2811231 RepID=A0ABS3C1F7_9BACT|nr:type II toxin-antitoxin system RelE/ParE family toxin [Algoriphagus oliviformis]